MNDPAPLPRRVSSRADAQLLWRHLAAHGIAFHWEPDAAAGVTLRAVAPALPHADAARLARLCDEVSSLGDRAVIDDAFAVVRAFISSGQRPWESGAGARAA